MQEDLYLYSENRKLSSIFDTSSFVLNPLGNISSTDNIHNKNGK